MKFFFIPSDALCRSRSRLRQEIQFGLGDACPTAITTRRRATQLYNRYHRRARFTPTSWASTASCVNEHHQNAYGLMPIPGVIAGALARRDQDCKIAVLGRALPLLNYPLMRGRGIRDARQHLGRAADRRFRARHRRRISLHRRQSGRIARPLPRGARSDHRAPGPSRARSPSRASTITFNYVNTWPTPGAAAASADLDPLAGQQRDHRMGGASVAQIHLSADLQPGRPARALHGHVSRIRPRNTATRRTPEQLGWAMPIYVRRDRRDRASSEARPHIEAF